MPITHILLRMAARVEITADAREELASVPVVITHRIEEIFKRLERWPAVSGCKPLRKNLKGFYRIRTGGWRVMFRVADDLVTVVKIDNRRDIYEE